MTSRLDRKIIIGLILLTTLPFLLLFSNLSEVLPITDFSIFWRKFVFILGNVSGFVGTVLLVWSFMLGVRSLVGLITPDLVWVLKVHKWIGKYGLLLAIIHPLLEMVTYLEGFLWLFIPNLSTESETHITYGRLGFILFLVIYVTSALVRDKIKFRPWLYVHYLSYPVMLLTFLHANDIGSFLNMYPALKALWFTWFAMYFVLILYRFVEWAGWLKPKYVLDSKFKQTDDILVLVFEPKGNFLKPKPGQFVYLQLKPFGETHPFSVMEFEESAGRIMLGIKIFGNFTKKVELLEVGSEASLSGPFGVFTQEAHNQKLKVLIAGGIGITPFVDVINKYKTNETILLYAARNRNQIILHDKFKLALGANYTAFLSDETDVSEPNLVGGMITPESLLKAIKDQSMVNKYQYFLCGPPPFMKGVRNSLISLGVSSSQIYSEEFSY